MRETITQNLDHNQKSQFENELSKSAAKLAREIKKMDYRLSAKLVGSDNYEGKPRMEQMAEDLSRQFGLDLNGDDVLMAALEEIAKENRGFPGDRLEKKYLELAKEKYAGLEPHEAVKAINKKLGTNYGNEILN